MYNMRLLCPLSWYWYLSNFGLAFFAVRESWYQTLKTRETKNSLFPLFSMSDTSSLTNTPSYMNIKYFCLANLFPAWVNARRALTQDDVFSTHVLKRSFRV
eukprot:sb/3478448/